MRRYLGWALVVALFAGALLAPSAGAKVRYPRLDGSFGSGGYVALPDNLLAPGGEPVRLEGLSAAPGGGVYGTQTSGGPCGDRCLYKAFLSRVKSDGSVATTFGGGGRVEVASGIERVSPAISDPQGRALIATQLGSSLTVHRYLSNGSADASFGSGGTTTFDCGCGATGSRQIRLAVDRREGIVVSINTLAQSGAPIAETLVRLLPNGAVNGSFGSHGVVQLGAQSAPLDVAFGSNDAIYTWGGPRYSETPAYLHRVSAKGLVDTTFNERADKTLSDVNARGTLEFRNAVLIVRPHGLLDLYGGDGLVRLRSNGAAEAKFGDGGVRLLGWTVIAATLAANGKVLGLGVTSEGVSLIRLQANGRPDRSFGSEGARLIEGVNEEEGLGLARLNGRRALVTDLGATACRYGGCTEKGSIVRYRIGPKS